MSFDGFRGPARTTTLSLRGRALRLLSQRDHSRVELSTKLRPHAESADDLSALLSELSAQGWLDDQRTADSLVHKQSGKFGSARIRQDMQAKGLSSELVAQALADLADSEASRAQTVWQKKFGAWAQTPAERAKQMRFLLARGFSASVASRVVNSKVRCETDDAPHPPRDGMSGPGEAGYNAASAVGRCGSEPEHQ